MTDAQIRDKILSVLYDLWKRHGFDAWMSLHELSQCLSLDFIAVERNADLLVGLGLVERKAVIGGAFYRISAGGVLECERKGL